MKNPFGPWATAMHGGLDPQLSTFWRQRMSRLPDVARSRGTLSPRAAVGLVLAALAVGAMPTLYGSDPPAETKNAPPAGKPDAAPPADAGQIDLTYLPTSEHGFAVCRPAAIHEHWAKEWDGTYDAGLLLIRLADFRQISLGATELNYDKQHGNERVAFPDVVFQSARPLEVASLFPWICGNPGANVRETAGWKTYAAPAGCLAVGHGNRVVIFGAGRNWNKGGGQALVDRKRGALPACLPVQTWEEFKEDVAVLAVTGADLRAQWDIWESSKRRQPAQVADYQFLAPFLEAKFVLLGIHLGQTVRVHGVSAAGDEAAAARVERAVGAARDMALKAIREEQAAAAKNQAKTCLYEKIQNAIGEPVLSAMRFSREGTVVRMESRVPMKVLHDSVASLLAGDRSSGNGSSPAKQRL